MHGLGVPIIVALSLIGVVVAGMSATMVVTVRSLDATSKSQRATSQMTQESLRLERLVVDLETGVRGYMLTDDPRFLEPYRAGRLQLATSLVRLHALAPPALEPRIARIDRNLGTYINDYTEPLIRDHSGDVLAATTEGKTRLDALRKQFAALSSTQSVITVQRRAHSQALRKRMLILASGGALVCTLLLIALGIGLRRMVLLPVRRVAHAAEHVAFGRLDTRVPANGFGEIGQLGATFNTMAAALAEREGDLSVQTDRLQSILDYTTTTISVKDRDGRYLLVNDEWRRAMGQVGVEVFGRTDDELFAPEIAAAIRVTDLDILRSGEAAEFERDAATEGRAFQLVKFPLKDAGGHVYATGTMGTDVSERKRALAEAVEASRSKSEFLANMSHEIRTPLNGVIGMTELLLGSDLSPQQRDYALTAASSSEALLDVINDILDFSKIEAGKLELDHHDFDLREAVEDTCEMLAPQAHGKNLELMAWIDADVATVVNGDRGRLRQVLTNLLSNAVKFTEAGEVTVRVRNEDAAVRFDVTDSGIGISRKAIERLFDSFAQADTSTTRRYGGTGLGLTISRQLVELMGGEISVVSTPGAGSTFSFTVQLGEPSSPHVARRTRSALPEALHVLVVDDNATNRDIVEAYLEAPGVTCATAAGATEALTAMHAAARNGEPFELVILDGQMPEMDGIELAQAISLAPSLRSTRLLMLTSTTERRLAARDAGIHHYLQKPVRRARLLETVAEAMGTLGAPGPVLPAPAHGAGKPTSSSDAILVVEDNAVNQRVIEAMLGKRGYEVEIAVNGREALTMLTVRHYALVFMDCQMPEMDGYAATAAIRSRESDKTRLPIVAMTAHAMTGDRERCLAVGMDDYLSKPLRPEELDAVLARWLGTPGGAPEPTPSRSVGPAPAGDPFEALLDDARMRIFRVDYPEIIDQLIELFVDSTPPLLGELRAGAESGDSEAVRRAAHRLKGSCQNIGAGFMAKLAADIEHSSTASPAALDGLQRVFEDTRDALRSALLDGDV
ncbi:response regulator [Solirubrobacter ginsenosidimutans]|uniref:Circadian input-output histidine kinase CikA n=1 Tax=Solirubrobacter ginsenosidimutans TaxID=490573 RepID=A0A9X3S899_9ACTN|nr:response regulator [Solirubrobacter ginsenosidimutans]MDA0166786.1 response regulator [Solirubrobacter ginsenosidimutans]